MHIVHNLALRQQDDQILRDKAHSLLFHLLRNPDAGILGHTKLSANHAHVSTVQVARTPDDIWIPRGNRHFRQVTGKFLCIGIEILYQLIDILSRLYFQHLSAHILGHRNKLDQRIGIGDGLYIVERRHVILHLHILAILLQYIFFVTHSLSLIVFSLIISFHFSLLPKCMECLLRECHHLMAISPWIQSAVDERIRQDVG